MINDPKFNDPLYPQNPALGYGNERRYDGPPEVRSGSGRATFAIVGLLAALFVAGLVIFSGGENVDPMQTASPGIDRQTETMPGDATAEPKIAPLEPAIEPAAPAE
ncbi:MAG: hypothetical protein JJ911_01935 [Rhizobiaceae bacterium]|nr:hypothetical protein [Rhizobiaceae bacterium]